jgi:hypothetical protein
MRLFWKSNVNFHTKPAMTRAEASQQIHEHCKTTGVAVMKIHPLLKDLADDATKGEIVKALYEVTKNIEVVKKQLMKLEKRDDNDLV